MPRRVEYRIQKKHAVTILGEGITEQHYFTHIRTLFGYNYTIKPYYFSVTSLTEMDKKIAEAITDGGYAIAVFDADVANRNDAEKKKLESIETPKYLLNIIFKKVYKLAQPKLITIFPKIAKIKEPILTLNDI